MKRENALAKNTFIISFGTFLPKLASLVTLPIITGSLTKAEYGTYDLISTLASLFLPFATLQIQSAAFRFLIDCRDKEMERKRIITNIYGFLLPISLFSLSILYFALRNIDSAIKQLICIYFAVDIILLTTQQIIRGLSKNKLYSLSAVIHSIVNLLMILLTISYLNKGLFGVLISIIVASIVAIIVLMIAGGVISNIDPSLLSWNTTKELLSYSWPMIPNSLSNWALSFSDRTVVTLFLGLEANAIYSVACKIPLLFTTVQSTFVYAWQENASMFSKDSDVDEYYSRMFESIFRILIGIMSLLIAFSPILFLILIRGDYDEAYYQMPILFIAMLFSSLASFMGGIYVAHKKTKSVGITTVIAAGMNLIIDLALIHYLGIFAASLSTLISYVFLTIYRMIDVQRFQRMSFDITFLLKCLMILIVMSVLCWANTAVTICINLVLGTITTLILNRELVKWIVINITMRIHQ